MTTEIVGFHANLRGTENEIRSSSLLVQEGQEQFVIGHPDPAKERHRIPAAPDDRHLHLLAEGARTALLPYRQKDASGPQRVMVVGEALLEKLGQVLPANEFTLDIQQWIPVPDSAHRAAVRHEAVFEDARRTVRDALFSAIASQRLGAASGPVANESQQFALFQAVNPREDAGYLAKLAVLHGWLSGPEAYERVALRAGRIHVPREQFDAMVEEERAFAREALPSDSTAGKNRIFYVIGTSRTKSGGSLEEGVQGSYLGRGFGRLPVRGPTPRTRPGTHGRRWQIPLGDTLPQGSGLSEGGLFIVPVGVTRAEDDETPGKWSATRLPARQTVYPFKFLAENILLSEDKVDSTSYEMHRVREVGHD